MPIHRHGNDDYYYMTDLYDEIIDKIIEHTIVELVIENNTDTSLKTLLEEKNKKKRISFMQHKRKI